MESCANPFVTLAQDSIRYYLDHSQPLPCPEELPEELRRKAAAFVSIKKGRELRGCIGTLTPTRPSLAEEIIHNAISAATRDPRFSSVTREEIPYLAVSVDVLTPMEEISGLSGHDTRRYGLVVKCGDRQGVLLPDLEGIDDARDQLGYCLRKGRVGENENYQMFRFEVQRFH
ncbi:MAG: AmmeMemoRadiSam system protein A [Nitrospinae bacterium CG11_big_fil_rev_8_21_14_0_20_56_8]|nr:MAG: AmmeMemoRadiSam system protein A [Nitrospinae bacterium CG11_big_fil_rev_8_21_14_0_20_56_8]